MALMTGQEFANKAKDIANNYKTLYVYGCFGAPMNATNKERYKHNYAYNEQPARQAKINAASYDTFGFDCVCLLKGILWGWNGNVNATYGGARYASNGVPDVSANGMMDLCRNRSTNFSNIKVGEAVGMNGHIGIYIGNGLAVECTPIWKDGVQITAVGNIGKKSGYNTRTWTSHGELPWIDYSSQPTPQPTPTPTPSDKYNIGDKVVINGPLYTSSDAASPAGSVSNKVTTITRKAPGTAHPYNTEGDLGWMNESDIQPYVEPTPQPEPTPAPTGLQVGDRVKIIGTGNASSYGDQWSAASGYTGTISRILADRPYPYCVDDDEGPLGWYKADALEKI